MTADFAQVLYIVLAYFPLLAVVSFIAPIILPTFGEIMLWLCGSASLNLLLQIVLGKYSVAFLDAQLIAAAPWFVGVALTFVLLGAVVRRSNGGHYVPEDHPALEDPYAEFDLSAAVQPPKDYEVPYSFPSPVPGEGSFTH